MCNERPPVAKPGHEGSTTSSDSTWWPSSRHSIQGTSSDINWQEIYCNTVWREEAKVTKRPPAWQSLIEFGDIWRQFRTQEIFTELTCLDMCSHSPFFAGLATSPAKSPPAATREDGMKSEAALSFGSCFGDVCLCTLADAVALHWDGIWTSLCRTFLQWVQLPCVDLRQLGRLDERSKIL